MTYVCILFSLMTPGAVDGTAPPGWPESISTKDGFNKLGRAIANESGFPKNGSDIEKARYVYGRLDKIADVYDLEAGSGLPLSQAVIGAYRFGSDPEGADSMKGATGWGNCGEWSYAFSEILGGAGVPSRMVFADTKKTGSSWGHGGTDTTVIVEE